ncbi:MAG: GtrA family protein [Bacteroidales bacterium]|nr:GtrA family protein [Bacteroidales bacterium]
MFDLITGEFIWKFIKFGIVGFSGLIVDFGITYICKEKIRIQKYISNAIGFIVAASTNYILNRIWTFQSHNPQIALEYSQFLIISLIGLGINTLILWLIVSKLKKNFYLSKLFAIAVVTIWNFLANAFITFG